MSELRSSSRDSLPEDITAGGSTSDDQKKQFLMLLASMTDDQLHQQMPSIPREQFAQLRASLKVPSP